MMFNILQGRKSHDGWAKQVYFDAESPKKRANQIHANFGHRRCQYFQGWPLAGKVTGLASW
jgi:hypothetical protein